MSIFIQYSLHREALKQSATDPMSGKIDVNILTTGLSSMARKKRGDVAAALRKMIESKGKTSTLKYQKAFNEFKSGSAVVCISIFLLFYAFLFLIKSLF